MIRAMILAALIFATPLLTFHTVARLYAEPSAGTDDCPSARPGSRAEQPLKVPLG